MQGQQEKFVAQSLRHLAQLRHVRVGNPDAGLPYPDGWFDLPQPVLADLGAMFFLTSLSPFHRNRPLSQVFSVLEPALRLKQYRIFRSDGHPRAFVTWAGLNRAAEHSFAVDHQPLKPEQWNSGNSVWVVDLVSPFGHIEQVIRMLSANDRLGRLRTLWHNRAGTRARVIEWTRQAPGGDIRVTSYGRSQFSNLISRD